MVIAIAMNISQLELVGYVLITFAVIFFVFIVILSILFILVEERRQSHHRTEYK